MMTIFLVALGAWVMADFVSGIVHWYEDRAMVGKSKIGFLNTVRADNERHHKEPVYLLKHSYWGNISTTAPIAWVIAGVLFAVGAPSVVWLAFVFMGFGNLVHRFSHTPPGRLPSWIKFLQRTGLFLSPSHHSGHHFKGRGKLVQREEASMRYCVMSDWLNPTLDRIGFFRFLDRIFKVAS